MRKLSVFDNVSLDGYFTDKKNDMSWAHKSDPEWIEWSSENAKGGGALVFGRVTYDMMVAFWPTPAAAKSMPAIAERMNHLPKIVFSRTLDEAKWQNTRVVKGDIVAEMRKIKSEPGDDMVIMGSGTIVAQMTEAGLVDELKIVVVPIILGAGRTLFEGVTSRPALQRTESRAFENGNVYTRYQIAR